MTSLNVNSTLGDPATVSSIGPRGGTRWVADLTEDQLRRFALECEGQADLIHAHKLDSDFRLGCVCVTGHLDSDFRLGCVCVTGHEATSCARCTGEGTRANNGYCTGCRSVEFGTQGKPALITHVPARR
jgi:hypothetical protein